MKRILTLVVFACAISTAFAQLPNGAVAPNFTAKDINGRSWDLYEILDSGRPVVIDVSATWCGPCWNYHNSGQLENYFAAHGPEGDGKSFVFFIEGDGSTNLACLYGGATCNGGTQGNWVEGTPYPILDNAGISNSFEVTYFPTGLLICPDKKSQQVDQYTASQLWTKASACVGNIPANYAKVSALDPGTRSLEICTQQTVNPTVVLSNLGGTKVTKVTMELRWNDALIQTKTFTANTGILDQETLIFDPIVIASVGTLSAEIVSVNDGANFITAKASADIVAAPAKYTKQSIVLNLRTDANPKDIYWYVTDDSGNELAHGGNNAVGPNGGALYPGGSPDSPSAYPANTLVKDTFDVPVNSCFTLTVVDGAGDGIIPPGLIRLFDLGSTSPFYTKIGATAAGYDAHTFAPKTSGTAEATEISSFAVYPNPAADVLNITYTLDAASDCHLTVSNATGQLVRSQFSIPQALGQNQHQLSLEGLANGMYFLNMQTASGIKSVRFVVAR